MKEKRKEYKERRRKKREKREGKLRLATGIKQAPPGNRSKQALSVEKKENKRKKNITK